MDIDDSLKEKILNLIHETYYNDIEHNMTSRKGYKCTADVVKILAQVSLFASTIVTFVSGYYTPNILVFIGGGLGTLSLSLLRFSSYSIKESKKRTEIINTILKSLNMKEIVDIALDGSTNEKCNKPHCENNDTVINIQDKNTNNSDETSEERV